MLYDAIAPLLPGVQKPARYTGGEVNMVKKNPEAVRVRFAFCFPDTYEVGMSHLGMKILYHILNKREEFYCERVFAPWMDMERAMRENQIPLYSLETFTPVRDFDLVGFTLQYEMSYTNVLNMLDLAGIRRAVRSLEKAGAPKFNRGGKGYYKAIVGPDAKFSLLGDPLWEDKAKYQQAEQIENGEIGKLFGVIFLESSEAPVYTGAGASSADVGATLIFGEDAYGVVDLGQVGASPVRTIVKPLGSAGTADPLDQMATVGWKVDGFAAVILNGDWIVRLEHAIEA